MERFYFTFGVESKYAKKFVVINAEDAEEAEAEMTARFGTDWEFQYTEGEWENEDGSTIDDDWNLTELIDE